VTEDLLTSFGYYGGALVLSFLAGLFPLLSIEVFLVGMSAVERPSPRTLGIMIVLAAIGHQLAKTITYYAGAGAMEMPRGKVRDRIDRAQQFIDRWNKRPGLVMVAGATIGLPPMYLLGFIAGPLMAIRFWPFTLITFFGRLGRYATMAFVPLLF